MLATAFLNSRVRNGAGENLGKIEDIVIDPATGDVQYVILSAEKFYAVPWSALSISPSRDYVLLNIDKDRLAHAPSFDRDHWPDTTDSAWRRSIHDYYHTTAKPVVHDHRVYVERRIAPRRGMSLFAGIALIVSILALGWVGYLVSTRGWEQATQDIQSSVQGAAYAAKETSYDVALTTKVKTALSLSKRIPSDKISVDSEGDVVTLRGEVPSNQIHDLAETIVRDVPGVQEVHNHLFVVSGTQ